LREGELTTPRSRGPELGWMLWNPRTDSTGTALRPKEAVAAQ